MSSSNNIINNNNSAGSSGVKEAKSSPSHVVKVFQEKIESQPDIAVAVAAIQALTCVVKESQATTMMGLEIELKAANDELKQYNPLSISLAAGSELFSRYVTRTSLELVEFQRCKERLIERGHKFSQMSLIARQKISVFGNRFIRDGQSILVHGSSRVILSVLSQAAGNGKRFNLFITDPSAAEKLLALDIEVTLIPNSAVGYIMEKIDLVLVGAEAVVENGGIINQVGTYTIGLCCQALNTPFYVCAESYKFARMFPLTQSEIQQDPHCMTSESNTAVLPKGLVFESPKLDYTPPGFITLLFTDLGILTPSAISDELIKLYY